MVLKPVLLCLSRPTLEALSIIISNKYRSRTISCYNNCAAIEKSGLLLSVIIVTWVDVILCYERSQGKDGWEGIRHDIAP